jgi:hypothetical protein
MTNKKKHISFSPAQEAYLGPRQVGKFDRTGVKVLPDELFHN